MRRDTLDGPFAVAADEARPLGTCPINMLDDFHASHRDHDSPCSGFGCGERAATPEDFGCEHWWRPGDPDEGPPIPTGDPGDHEVDFWRKVR